ncbi:MAG: malate dehydrogenase [Acidiferrobacteraceae bacterium]
MRKITIVGAGRVGEAAAQILAKEEFARELVLIGVRPGVAEGTALDLDECGTLFGFDTQVRGGVGLHLLANSDLIVVAAGVPRRPGMSRADVLAANLPVIDAVADAARTQAPDALAIIVTNPVDTLTYRFRERTGWDRRRVFGLSGVLDGARMAAFIALETGLSVLDVYALVIGGHGDTMVPLKRFCTIAGIPLDQFLAPPVIDRIVRRTRSGGSEILALKKNSSAYDAPGAAIAAMVDAIVRDRRRLMACSCCLDGEYGHRGVAIGVPAVIGRGGAERIVELALPDEDALAFERSVDAVRAELALIPAAPPT